MLYVQINLSQSLLANNLAPSPRGPYHFTFIYPSRICLASLERATGGRPLSSPLSSSEVTCYFPMAFRSFPSPLSSISLSRRAAMALGSRWVYVDLRFALVLAV